MEDNDQQLKVIIMGFQAICFQHLNNDEALLSKSPKCILHSFQLLCALKLIEI